jgi:4-aminobutyrate aminotransferase-like enzyme
MAERLDSIGEARGIGAMQAIEIVRDRKTKSPAPGVVDATIRTACERGLLLLRAGLYSNVIRTLVPLTITDVQLNEGLDVLEASLAANTKDGGGSR